MEFARKAMGRERRILGGAVGAAETRVALRPSGASDSKLLEWNRLQCSWPSLYYSSTVPFLRAIGARHIAEVGVAYGYHADAILAGVTGLNYVGVDPYLSGYDEADAFAADVARLFDDEPQSSMDRLHAVVKHELSSRYGNRAQVLRSGSREASRLFADGTFDAVFVDGDHRFEAVLDDLRVWWPKVRPGGSVLGDDYQRGSVAAAWEEFMDSVGAERFFLENSTSGYRTIVAVKEATAESLGA